MKKKQTPRITVAVRKRPLNKKQLQKAETDIIRVDNHSQITISEYKQKVDLTKYLQETSFNFDHVYSQTSTNEQIYQESIRPLIENAFMGAKISCFAYGQTGSGKTHTMKGDMSKGVPGLYFLGAKQIFYFIEQPQFRHLHVTVSFYEIYCGRLHDLLNKRAELVIRQDKKQNINVIGLEERIICSAQEFLDVIEYGSGFRVTSQNATNAESSRSHAILQISLKQNKKTFTKISFIDLAGNQRGADHMDQNKQTKIDGAEINKSLLALKQCIRALDQGKGHTPFRGSKLTMVLKDSFVGFCNTVMICNVSPNSSSSQNTMNTLRYADRVKQLKGSENQTLTKQQKLERELMLPRANKQNVVKVTIDNNDDNDDVMMKMEQARNAQNSNFNLKRSGGYEQKMQIQQPSEYKKVTPTINNRRTQNIQIEQRYKNTQERKSNSINKKQFEFTKNNNNQFSNNIIKGKYVLQNEKQPLILKNVHINQINQNNLNMVNLPDQQHEMNKKASRNSSFPLTNNYNQGRSDHNLGNLIKNHFQAMNNLRTNFERYNQNHEGLIRDEMGLLKQEMILKQQLKRMKNGSYQQQIDSVGQYINNIEMCVMRKIELFNIMKDNIDRIKNSVKMAGQLTNQLKYQEQSNSYSNQNHNFQNKIFMNPNPHNFHKNNNPHNSTFNNFTNNPNIQNINGFPLISNNSQFHNIDMNNNSNHMGMRNNSKFHVHSTSNMVTYNDFNGGNGYNQYGDQQLLQGLSEDDRLF